MRKRLGEIDATSDDGGYAGTPVNVRRARTTAHTIERAPPPSNLDLVAPGAMDETRDHTVRDYRSHERPWGEVLNQPPLSREQIKTIGVL